MYMCILICLRADCIALPKSRQHPEQAKTFSVSLAKNSKKKKVKTNNNKKKEVGDLFNTFISLFARIRRFGTEVIV